MKSVMHHFDLSSIPLFLNIATTSIDGTKNFALLRKNCNSIFIMKNNHGGESRDLNDRVHGISCQYSDKTSKQTYHTFLNTQTIFIKHSAHTS